MVHKYDTERAVGLLREYQANLTSPEEQALKTSVGKVSAILGSQLFQALLVLTLDYPHGLFCVLCFVLIV
ncbi:hypothetical protein AMECASPLE_031536 [Ameca splendens]|uniref:L27-1 domain-containing protein n=1 Tax=Ameca splendens TaxID=208324 RepID=A0ABV0Y6J4_9TELE